MMLRHNLGVMRWPAPLERSPNGRMQRAGQPRIENCHPTRIPASTDLISGSIEKPPTQRHTLGLRTCSTPRFCRTTPTNPASPSSSSRPPFRSGRGCSQAMRRPPLQPRLPRSTRPQRLSANVCAPRNGCSLTGLTPIRPSSILTRAKANRGHLEVVKGKVVDCANDAGPRLNRPANRRY
jgi:hypothetical protein